MHIVVEQRADALHISLVGEANIYAASQLQQSLQEAVVLDRAIHIDLSQVSAIDTAGLQQLYLAKREANTRGQLLQLVEHSAATLEVIDLFGMNGYFGAAMVIPAAQHTERTSS